MTGAGSDPTRSTREAGGPGIAGSTARPDPARAGVVEEFVRFCRRRRRVGWPELYDEMCAVAGRGLFRGWSFVELAEQGIGFTLGDMPRLAAVVEEVVRAERAVTAAAAGGMVALPGREPETLAAPRRVGRPGAAEGAATEVGSGPEVRIAAAATA